MSRMVPTAPTWEKYPVILEAKMEFGKDRRDDYLEFISNRLDKQMESLSSLKLQAGVLHGISKTIAGVFSSGKKLLLFGNGGSAADAQHMAGEFVGRFKADRAGLPAMALAADTSAVTCIANDFGFEKIFERQIEAFGRPGDAAVAISTTGSSRNVILGIEKANEAGLVSICLTGKGGKGLAGKAALSLVVNSTETPVIQEVHMTAGHIICEIVEKILSRNSE